MNQRLVALSENWTLLTPINHSATRLEAMVISNKFTALTLELWGAIFRLATLFWPALDFSGHRTRTSGKDARRNARINEERMPDRMPACQDNCQIECHKIYQIEGQKFWQRECRKNARNYVRLFCHGWDHAK